MADGINVGSVLVTVIPDARGWDEKLSAQVTPAAEAIGRRIGKTLEDDIADGVRRGMEKAKLELSGLTGGDIKVNVDVDNTAALAKLAEVDVAAKDAQKSAAASAGGMGPLIAAAIAGGLALGGPAIVGAAGVAAAGIAAVFLRNQQEVAASAKSMFDQVKTAYSGVADGAIPQLTLALGKLQGAAIGLAPQMRDLFNNVGPAIQGVTDGIIGLAQGAMPGLISMIKSGGPVFDGLKNFLTSIGTGLGQTFQILSEHASAFGQVFTSLGDVLHAVLPALGDLMAVGGELGAAILPPLAAVLGVVSDVLHLIAPVLPEVALGFAAFKVVSLLSGPLESFATVLGNLAAKEIPLVSRAAGGAASAIAGLGAALPGLGIGVALAGALFVAHEQDITNWAQALLKGGAAARQAAAEMDATDNGVHKLTSGFLGGVGSLLGYGGALSVVNHNSEEAKQKTQDLLAAMDPLHRAQALAAQAQNDLSDALSRGDTAGAAKAMAEYQKQTSEAQRQQNLLNAALDKSSVAEEENKTRLQNLANAASAGNTQINLLKGALDALTGKAVSLGDAEVAVTTAVGAATTALQGKKGALVDATGAVNLHTEAGAALWQSMTQIASADNTLIATMEKQGATAGQVSAKDAELRQQFINTATQMGLTAGQAQNLANQIYGIPEQRKTEITVDTAQATQAATDLANRIAAIQSKTITVGVNYHVAGLNGGPGGTQLANAQGNIVHAYAGGGMEPMQGGTAAIVGPQTYRIIGDRVTDDEAYIPINNSMRSLNILAETASRMNFALTPAGAGAGRGGGPVHVSLQLDGAAVTDLLEGRMVRRDKSLAQDARSAL